MGLLSTLALVATAIPNIHYYTASNPDSSASVADGVTVTTWEGDAQGAIDLSLGVPYMTTIGWSKAGVSYPTNDSYQCSSTTYVVVEGNVTISIGTYTDIMLEQNDVLWVRAGQPHSPFVSVTSSARVSAFVGPYNPRYGSAPSIPTEAASLGDYTFRFYLNRKRTFSGSLVDHYQWTPATTTDPNILSVLWRPTAQLGAHYHAEGALYIVNKGKLCFNFTAGDGESCIGAGEARWARAGYRYTGEYTDNTGALIIVLNIASGPNMRDIPDDNFISDHHVAICRACS